MSYENDKPWQTGTTATNSSGGALITFPIPFPPGVVPIVNALAIVPAGSTSNYNVELQAVPTNTSAKLQVNVTPQSISLLGLNTLSPFAAAPSGVQIEWEARAP